MRYIAQLPPHVRAEIRRDAYRITSEWYGNEMEEIIGMSIEELVENCTMTERLCNVIGLESEGMLDAVKYRRYL